MALVFTPTQLANRAALYQQLSSLNEAGIPLIQALELQLRKSPARSFRAPLQQIVERLNGGSTFAEAVQSTGNWIPAFDVALIQAGEKSGRLPNVFRQLAQHYEERAALARMVLAAVAYPAFLFHFAIFILPFPTFYISGKWAPYLGQTLGMLLPIYAVIAFVIYAAQGQHGEQWRATIEKITACIPVLGSARKALALSRLSMALEALITAGVPIIEAWEMAAAASGSPALRRAVLGWRAEVDGGTTPAEALSKRDFFPELFTNLYYSGEVSGQLDDTLKRLHANYHDEGKRKLKMFAVGSAFIFYLAVVGFIAYNILSYYMKSFQEYNDVMK
jgi:type II secretory pathway component PulF